MLGQCEHPNCLEELNSRTLYLGPEGQRYCYGHYRKIFESILDLQFTPHQLWAIRQLIKQESPHHAVYG